MYLFKTAHLATTLASPTKGQVWGRLSSKFVRVCCVSRVHVPCVFLSKINHVVRLSRIYTRYLVSVCVQVSICGRGFEPRQALLALLFAFYFRLLFFSALSFFCAPYYLCIWSIYPWIHFVKRKNKHGSCKIILHQKWPLIRRPRLRFAYI